MHSSARFPVPAEPCRRTGRSWWHALVVIGLGLLAACAPAGRDTGMPASPQATPLMLAVAPVAQAGQPVVWPAIGHAGVTIQAGRILASALLISEHHAITSAHVVHGMALQAPAQLRRGDAVVAARLLGVSGRMDLAVLRLSQPLPGRPAMAAVAALAGQAGYAAGLDGALGVGHLVAAGIWLQPFGIGSLYVGSGFAAGFSGGPLLNAAGEVVGIVTAVRRAGSSARGAPVAAGGASGLTTESGRSREGAVVEVFALDAGRAMAEAHRLIALATE